MKKFLCLLLPAVLAVVCAAENSEKIDLGSGRAALLSLPDTWQALDVPPRPAGMPAMGATARYAPKNGSNDAVLITVVTVPDDQFADPDAMRAMAEMSVRRFVRGSVEGRADFKEFRVGGKTGYACLFTDANLVGKPAIKDDYKTLTSCFVYLGDGLLLSATIFSDDPSGEAYATARRIVQSLTVSLPKNTI